MPSAVLGGQTSVMTTTAQFPRLNDIGGYSSKYTADKTRISNGPTPSRGSLNNEQSWSGSIWTNGSLGTSFGPAKRDRLRSKDGTQPSKPRIDADEAKTGSGSLLATSELDSWSISRSAWADTKPHGTASVHGRHPLPKLEHTSDVPTALTARSKSYVDTPSAGTTYVSRQQSTATNRDTMGKRASDYAFNLPDPSVMSTASSRSAVDASREFGLRPNSSREQNGENAYGLWAGMRSRGTPTERQRSHPGSDYFDVPNGTVSHHESLPTSRGGMGPASYYLETDVLPQYEPQQFPHSTRGAQPDRMVSFPSQASTKTHLQYPEAASAEMHSSFENLCIEDNGQTLIPFRRDSTLDNSFAQLYPRTTHDFGSTRQALADLSQNVLRLDDQGVYRGAPLKSDTFARARFCGQVDKQDGFHMVGPRYGSSAGAEYLRNLNNPYYPPGGAPLTPLNPPPLYQPGDQRAQVVTTSRDVARERRIRGIQQTSPEYFHPPYQPIMTAHFADPYGARYNYGLPASYPANSFVPHFPVYAMAGMLPAPPRSPKDLDPGQSLRSALLEEFKSNAKTSKRYELRDIYDHIVEFSGDQHGSRFIQQKLETANSDEKERVFREIQTNAMQLMTDVFGNYVIQKFFEHGDQNQKKILANRMKGQVLSLSLQMYGCRVVQKALEHVLTDQQAAMVRELENNVIKCVKDQNGNHVVQKAIERVPAEHIQFIIDSFTGKVGELAIHPYGCRVVQRLLERCQGHAKTSILQELHAVGPSLISDQYGNYVTQHVIEQGGPEDRAKIISLLKAQLLTFSKHKFASNVVEKGLMFGTEEQRMEIVEKLAQKNERGETELVVLIKDQYGNYVIQKLLDSLNPVNYARFLDMLYPEIAKARRLAYGKQVQSIEKKMHRFDGMNNFHHSSIPRISTADLSGAPTPRPSLSDGRSPRSNSLPSTNTSTADGPVHSFNPSTFG